MYLLLAIAIIYCCVRFNSIQPLRAASLHRRRLFDVVKNSGDCQCSALRCELNPREEKASYRGESLQTWDIWRSEWHCTIELIAMWKLF